jgi:predicted flavoprotein YhiN
MKYPLYGYKESSDHDVDTQKTLSKGTLVEFSEKNREHVGKIVHVEHKINGSARYDIENSEGKIYSVAEKAITYAMTITPNDEKRIQQLFTEFGSAHEKSQLELLNDLDMSAELFEMAWEETLIQDEETHELTAKSLMELIHSRSASTIESYKAWKLLRTDLGHVFFKDIKDHGRVVSFKARAAKAVKAAKQTFCMNPDHFNDDLCFV